MSLAVSPPFASFALRVYWEKGGVERGTVSHMLMHNTLERICFASFVCVCVGETLARKTRHSGDDDKVRSLQSARALLFVIVIMRCCSNIHPASYTIM